MTASILDALIIGGGPAGGTAALLLARAGWSVAVLEKSTFPRQKVCGEFLSATNLPLLRHLGIAEPFLALAGPEGASGCAVFRRPCCDLEDATSPDRQRDPWQQR